jgi:hypothetical protein
LQQISIRYISATAPYRFIDAVKEDGETLTPDVLSERFQAFLQVRIVGLPGGTHTFCYLAHLSPRANHYALH